MTNQPLGPSFHNTHRVFLARGLAGQRTKKKETLIRLLGNTPFLMQIPKKVREREKKKKKRKSLSILRYKGHTHFPSIDSSKYFAF